MDELLAYVEVAIYKYEGIYGRLGLAHEDGLTGYYSPNLLREEIDTVDELL